MIAENRPPLPATYSKLLNPLKPTLNTVHTMKWKAGMCLKTFCIALAITMMLLLVTLLLPYSDDCKKDEQKNIVCNTDCRVQLVESIPEGLKYDAGSPKFITTYEAWSTLIDMANETLDIGSFYWTMLGEDVINHTSAVAGETIFKKLLKRGMESNLNLRVVESAPQSNDPNTDIKLLLQHKAADVRLVDFPRLVGGGVLHTKLWIVDGQHFYVGSANMDWRSLTQVKELGVLVTNCECLAQDVAKIFDIYWFLGGNNTSVPDEWPEEFSTAINNRHPLSVKFNEGYNMLTYFSSSPLPLSASGRSQDLDAILDTILGAKHFVNIAVMDYFPLIIYRPRHKYWPLIDDALKRAAIENKVVIRMLVSWWPHSNPSEDYFLRSLTSISNSELGVDVQIKRFIVPSDEDQSQIPYGRVNHNKYMVTDRVAYIGTSNWSGDYFTDTAGIGFVLKEITNGTQVVVNNLRKDLLSVFERDWTSKYAHNMTDTKNGKK